MKTQISKIIFGILFFIIIYLLASFYSVTFDIRLWEQDIRAIVTVIGGFVFFAVITYPNNIK